MSPMPEVTVCLPWRSQPDRIAPFVRCCKYWEDAGFTVVTGDSSRNFPFVCNEARNNAVRQADTELIIVADADTLPEKFSQINEAIDLITTGQAEIVYPHTLYRYIPPEWVSETNLYDAPIVGETFNSPGGILVADREAFWRINGFDERFIPGASGFDDTAFLLASSTLLRFRRVRGMVFSFDHPLSVVRDYGEDNPNRTRYRLYEFAQDNPALMAELVK